MLTNGVRGIELRLDMEGAEKMDLGTNEVETFLNDANAHCPLVLTDHHVPIHLHLRLQPPDLYLCLFSASSNRPGLRDSRLYNR